MTRRWDDIVTFLDTYNGHPLTEVHIDLQKGAVSFDELKKALQDLGIQLTEISYDSIDSIPEIKGYLVGPANISTKQIGKPHPKKVIFSGPATTIIWKDGTKTTVKCQRHDIYDKETGIAMCYLKKLLGNKGNFNNIFREAMKVAVGIKDSTNYICVGEKK